jgi:uncharacterized protein (TIGR00369 family)
MPGRTAVSAVTVADVERFITEEFSNTSTRCTAVGPGWAEVALDADAAMMRPGGIIWGPAVFSLADAALYYAVFTVAGIQPMALTSELSIRFMRPARSTGLRGRAELHHAGRRSVIGSVTVWTPERPDALVAVAQGTYVLPRD